MSEADDIALSEDRELLTNCNGLYVGQLRPAELAAFARLVAAGNAKRTYTNEAAALLGLATVCLL